MRIASFNVENLFDRAKIMNLPDWADGKPVLDAYAELNSLFENDVYTPANKARMIELWGVLGLLASDESAFVILRRNRGQLVRRPQGGGVEVVADGRGDWVGWLELKTAPVNEIATMNTGRVIRDLNADILAVIEAEDRVALRDFSDYVLSTLGGTPYANVMVIDGNDTRGIDVGLLTRAGYDIGAMRSHVHDRNAGGEPVFSRDCPEYSVTTPDGETIWVLVNHLKSKGYGTPAASSARRRAQAELVATYYRRLRDEGFDKIAVVGDMNDTPTSAPLAPLLAETDLRDVSEFPGFDTGEFAGKGTFGLGNDSNKIDYILLSPVLFERITAAGLWRKGAWPGSKPKRWSTYDELKRDIHAASDHHAIWVDLA